MSTIAERYRRFARNEAAGRSAVYESLALCVAKSPITLAFLEQLPKERRQPNLLFAALRLVAGMPVSLEELDHVIDTNKATIAEIMRTRSTQTNEPGRCAVLLPAISQIEGPLALIEVGASAGLCLLPDAYSYDWNGKTLSRPGPSASTRPVFYCKTCGNTPLPVRYPEIVWRAGLDINPLDVWSDEDVKWLEVLVWPEHDERLRHLRKAVRIARMERPRVVPGDLRKDLPALIAEAPRDATVVVFHTAVLSYIAAQGDRDAFAAAMTDNPRVVWLSNESPRTFPQFADTLGSARQNMFLMAIDGQPKAWTGPHGQEILWI
ncbi:DUF2332 domain-containing protein [Notoacmeibacter marinus]|uniref:DUF2332 domain-containing protein n=1 Tax=Notoacmeibacter marinus TaxID=1876515 RepID=UPI000DF1D9AB|nr:DUF2332 domain-containing protein [Notoacmeibacter marinus]